MSTEREPRPDEQRRRLLRLGTMAFLTAALGKQVGAKPRPSVDGQCGYPLPPPLELLIYGDSDCATDPEDLDCFHTYVPLPSSDLGDSDCGLSAGGQTVYKDNSCNPTNGDSSCGQPSPTGGAHSDDDCTGTPTSEDADCAKANGTGGAVHQDDDCGNPGHADTDCGFPALNNMNHTDSQCKTIIPGTNQYYEDAACSVPIHTTGPTGFYKDQICGLEQSYNPATGFPQDLDCGLAMAVGGDTHRDDDCGLSQGDGAPPHTDTDCGLAGHTDSNPGPH